jgi:two-component system, cell cycle response regulator
MAVKSIDNRAKVLDTAGRLQLKNRQLVSEVKELRRKVAELTEANEIDFLTGIGNRKKMDRSLHTHVTDLTRINMPLSLVAIDLDGLKPLNDTKGHEAGDALIKHVADVLRKSARESDTVCRYGGDEFFAILPNTDEKGAQKFIHRIRELLENEHTVSAGRATIRGIIEHTDAEIADRMKFLTATADSAMYEQKRKKGSKRILRRE